MKKNSLLLYLILTIFFALTNNSLSQTALPSQAIIYRCKKGKTFEVKFSSDIAYLTLKSDRVYKLKRVTSPSGVKYSDKKIELYTKEDNAFIQIKQKTIYDNCTSKLPDLNRPVLYDCEAQVAPFLNKESMTLEQAEKLLIKRDGNLFIYHCYPISLINPINQN